MSLRLMVSSLVLVAPVHGQGAVVKLKSRRGKEGKVVGRIDQETAEAGGADLVLKYGDAAESSGFRALWTDEGGELSAAGAFAGQVRYIKALYSLPSWEVKSNDVVNSPQGAVSPCVPVPTALGDLRPQSQCS